MIKPARVNVVLGAIFKALQQVSLYDNHPQFKAMTRKEYIKAAKERYAILKTFGIYKSGGLVGGAFLSKSGEGHMAVYQKHIGRCFRELAWFIGYGLSLFPKMTVKIDVDNEYALKLASKLGADWVGHEVNDDGCRAILELKRESW